jgi:hypothetical protein
MNASRSTSSGIKLYLTSDRRSFSHNNSNSGINRRKLINLIGINLSISIKSINENVLLNDGLNEITDEADGIDRNAER